MSTLGEKMTAHKKMQSIVENLNSEHIGDSTAKDLNQLFELFGNSYLLTTRGEYYYLEDAKALLAKCLERIRKEYSAKFMTSIGLIMMFQEDE